jgi:hypothetical protein
LRTRARTVAAASVASSRAGGRGALVPVSSARTATTAARSSAPTPARQATNGTGVMPSASAQRESGPSHANIVAPASARTYPSFGEDDRITAW